MQHFNVYKYVYKILYTRISAKIFLVFNDR